MRRRPVGSELVHMSLNQFSPVQTPVACDASSLLSSESERICHPVLPRARVSELEPYKVVPTTQSDEARVRARRHGCTRWHVAVGAEALVLVLLIVVVGQQLMSVLGAGASGGGLEGLAHDLGAGARELLARMSGTEARTWLPSVLAALLTIMGPWLRRLAARWGLAALVGNRTTSVVAWLIVAAAAGFWGQS